MPTALWYGSVALEAQPNSPVWEFGEKIRATTIQRGPYALALSSAPRRGFNGTGIFSGLLVESATVQREKGGIGVLTINYSGSLDGESLVPPDECEVEASQQEFPLENHPIFDALDDDMKNAVRAYVAAQNDEERQKYEGKIATDADAQLLRDKLLRRQEHFVLFPPVYSWTLYYLSEPTANAGGDIETPGGPLTEPAGYEWLRCADTVKFNGTYWTLTRKWVGAWEWDADIYPV